MRHLSSFTVAAVALLAPLTACDSADDTYVAPYTISVASSPLSVLPDRAATLSFTVVDVTGAPSLDAAVSAVASLGDATVDLGSLVHQADGVYIAAGVVLSPAGQWMVAVDVQGTAGTVIADVPVDVSCETTGGAGALCCAADACQDQMACVFGSCAAELGPVGGDCYENAECDTNICDAGLCVERTIPALGGGSHSLDGVDMTIVGSPGDSLKRPTDLAFNPYDPNHLWVTNQGTESVTVLYWAGTENQSTQHFNGMGTSHFLAKPASIAFGAEGTMATIHDTDDFTQGPNGTPKDFMGPTLHATTLETFTGGYASHMDMLHNSPLGVGISWEKENVYWVFDGYHSSITRYDFKSDHGQGGADHSDASVLRYVEGTVARSAGVPSHLQVHHASGMLYIADTGNNRVAVLDMASGTVGSSMGPNYDGGSQKMMNDAVINTFIDGVQAGMQRPSGLAIYEDVLYIGDAGLSRVWAFDLNTAEVIDYLDTGLPEGALAGIEIDSLGDVWVADQLGSQIIRYSPKR